VTLPSASDTTMVDHPAWDQNEFAKLSASLGLQNEETAADLSKLKAYQQYLKDMPAVSEMTVEDVLGKNSALDYQVQRQMDEMELYNVVTPERGVSYTPTLDPRKKEDPIFPDSDVVELINAPARALAADINTAIAGEVGKVFSGDDVEKFQQAVEGTLCQAPLVDPTSPSPELDFSGTPAVLEQVFAEKFPDVDGSAIVAAFAAEIDEVANGAAAAAAAAKAEKVSSAAAVCAGMTGTTAVFAGADAAKWMAEASKLTCVGAGADELLAPYPAVAAQFSKFVAKPTAKAAKDMAIAYSAECDDVEAVGTMVELLEALVIQSALYSDAGLKAELAAVFPSEAAQAKAYASWWPASGDAATDAVAICSPFDVVADSALSDADFVKTKAIVTKHMMAIA